MGYHILMTLCLMFIVNGCATQHKTIKTDKKKRLEELYVQSIQDGHRDSNQLIEKTLVEKESFGYVKPYLPVLQQPVVRKVWIPDQPSDDDPSMLIAGHWTYVMIQGPQWFTETKTALKDDVSIIPSQPLEQKDK